MSEQLQLRRGNAAAIAANAGALGEVFVDTDNLRLVLQDGTTNGGFPAAKLSEAITNTRTPIADAAYTAAATDRLIAYTSLTAARTVTLLAASAYPTGTRLTVVDESGTASAYAHDHAGAGGLGHDQRRDKRGDCDGLRLRLARIERLERLDDPRRSRQGGLSGALPPASGGSGVAAAALPFVVKATAVNANSVADTAIAIPLPSASASIGWGG